MILEEAQGEWKIDPSQWPINLKVPAPSGEKETEEWNFEVELDTSKKEFTLKFNDTPFDDLKLQNTAEPKGPQIINSGLIKMNKQEVFRGTMQYTRAAFQSMQNRALNHAPIRNLNIHRDVEQTIHHHCAMIPVRTEHSMRGIRTSEESVSDDLWDYLTSAIEQNTFDKLSISFYNENFVKLDNGLLQQLASKAINVTKLKLAKLRCSNENGYQLLKMAGKICTTNTQLKKLNVEGTRTTPEQGYEFLENLAESDMTGLEEIHLSGEMVVIEGEDQEYFNEWFLRKPEEDW